MSSHGRGDPERADVDARVLAWMREGDWRHDESRFEALALELFAYQYARCAPYRRFCDGRGRSPARLRSWREIPAVPTGAFKELALRSFPTPLTRKTFRTSGTATDRRGELHLDTLALYEASLLPTFRRFLLPDLPPDQGRILLRVLAPCPAEADDSSLSHMFGCALEQLGAPGSGFDVAQGALRIAPLRAALEAAAASSTSVLLAGTAFSLVHLLEQLERRPLGRMLPDGSRVMDTGGFKGRSHALSREALYERVTRGLGVPAGRIVNQYGMTELGSQFYDSVLREPGRPRRKLGPPWARVRVIDPESGEESRPGAAGIVTVVDLANTGSVLAVQTADLGRRIDDGFDVLGRAPGAEARGCSIAADAMLAEPRA